MVNGASLVVALDLLRTGVLPDVEAVSGVDGLDESGDRRNMDELLLDLRCARVELAIGKSQRL